MKKIFVTCLISFASVAFAQTCPTADEIFIKQGNRYDVVAPPGWRVVHDQRQLPNKLSFSVAAWGDHRHDTDPVRCHYYHQTDHVQIETIEMLPESQIALHPGWSGEPNEHYHLCSSLDVNACAFG